MVICQPGIYQRFVSFGKGRIIELNRATNEKLAFFDSEFRQCFEDLRQAHDGSLALTHQFFNNCENTAMYWSKQRPL